MRKITLLTTVTLLSMACLGSQKLNVDAASGCYQSSFGCGNKIIISYGSLDKFPCFPGINFPGNSKPEIEVPDNNIPNAPETEAPDNNIPENNKPENNVPEIETPEEVVKAWMYSAGHRANIMNKNFTKIGVGHYQDAKGVNYWSQLFIG